MDRTSFRDLPNQSEFDAISERIFLKVKEFIGHDALAKEITSDIQVSLVKEEVKEPDLTAWIHKKAETRTESYISELWEYCCLYAMKLMEDPDLAQDMTQTVMVSLLKAQQEITHVKGWLKQSVYNQCMLTVKKDKKSQELGKRLKSEPAPSLDAQSVDEEQLEKKLLDADIKRMLSKADYADLREMRSYKSLKEYAEAKGINPGAARKRKHSILTNLKATYLYEQGWVNVPEILDYRTVVNIKRFLNTLVEKNRIGDFKQLYHYCSPEMVPALQETLQNVQMIFDWGISQISPKQYQISIFDATNMESPSLAMVEIAINRANYIRITDCYGTALVGVIQQNKLDNIPLDKGKCLLKLNDVYLYTH